jgi:hypothetical protein
MSGRAGGAEPGPYWGLVRVELKADKDAEALVLQSPGTVGGAEDKAHCVFCAGTFSAQPGRVVGHFAYVGVQGQHPALGVAKCKGPPRVEGEREQDYAARRAEFDAACVAMRGLNAEKLAAAEKKAAQVAQDRATAPGSFVPGGAQPRPHKQLKLTDTTAAALKATTDLARGMIAANIPPYVLRNKFFRRGLLSVRFPRFAPPHPRWAEPARAFRSHTHAGARGRALLALRGVGYTAQLFPPAAS